MEIDKKKKPRKPCLIGLLLSLLIATDVFAQTVQDDLIGLGMKPEQAEYLSTILPAGSVLGNNTYLKARNQANSADLSILKSDTSDNTYINTGSGKVIIQAVAGTPEVKTSARNFEWQAISTPTPFSFHSSTSDAADNQSVNFTGGGAYAGDGSRGSYFILNGNEVSGAGDFDLATGSASGSIGRIRLLHSASTLDIMTSGGATFAQFDQTSVS